MAGTGPAMTVRINLANKKGPEILGAFCMFWNSPQCRIWERKSRVRSCCGFLKNSSGVFISTICP
jgi:hypothetical protein